MATYKVVDTDQLETDLTTVADAIRTKGGTSEALAFPNGMAEAISGIETGFWDEETVILRLNRNIVNITIPESVTEIGTHAFRACQKLKTINFPAGLTTIGQYAFGQCSKLVIPDFPATLTKIDNYAFQTCTSLISITFKGTPTSISVTAFNGCSNLTEIKVPWAEGAVANAPWGATNATITYNYTEEE